jgi:hypothetical protein
MKYKTRSFSNYDGSSRYAKSIEATAKIDGMTKLINITIVLLFFPVYLGTGSAHVATSSTVVIYGLFCLYLINRLVILHHSIEDFRFKILLFLLISIATVSAFSVSSSFLVKSLRSYINFVASLLFFFVIVNHNLTLELEERERWIEFILGLLVLMVVIQIVIGIILYFLPSFGSLLAIFYPPYVDSVETRVTDSGIKRLSSIIIRQESMGEAIATLLPFLLYLLAKTKKFIYLLAFIVFTTGVLMSATRSAIILFCFFFILYMLQQRTFFEVPQWFFLSLICTFSVILILGFFPAILDQVIYRFNTFIEIYEKGGSFSQVINRRQKWDIAIRATMSNLSLMGNGMTSIIGRGRTMNFHNLYLTVLHQMGVVGFIVFFGFIAKLLIRIYKSFRTISIQEYRLLAYSALLSLSILMINSSKYEFNRQASYEEYVWVLFAIYYLIAENIFLRSRSPDKLPAS